MHPKGHGKEKLKDEIGEFETYHVIFAHRTVVVRLNPYIHVPSERPFSIQLQQKNTKKKK